MFSYVLLSLTKCVSALFYRFQVEWLSHDRFEVVDEVRLLVLLNHTSLFEPLLVSVTPFQVIWHICRRLQIPVADTTSQRPIVGRLLTSLVPGMVPISRKRDHSWQQFLSQISEKTLVAILPEGRMKRGNGLDKFGNPMTVRGGVADILGRIDSGKILFVYSGGLHHIQIPGEAKVGLFKSIRVNLEMVDVVDYKQQLQAADQPAFVRNVVNDMQARLRSHVPHCPAQPCNRLQR